jgi:hypothetical protein
MSTILGADGKPPERQEQHAGANGHDKTETQDVRTVPMGVLIYNLTLCAGGTQMNKMMLQQMQMQMQQQKIIIDPPEVQHLKAILEHQTMARNVMVGEINFRFKDSDARRIAECGLEVIDRTEKAAPIDGEPV